MFEIRYPLGALKPAAYNPRRMDDTAAARLVESIRNHGCVIPLIARADGTLIAGHQRLQALNTLRMRFAPVYLIRQEVAVDDEARFNVLHNATEDQFDGRVLVGPSKAAGFQEISPMQIDGEWRAGAPARYQIANLISRYGPWGTVVATHSGEVVWGAGYAMACKSLSIPLRCRRIPENAAPEFKARYGRFSYDRLDRETWRQAACQRPRLVYGGQRECRSSLYERHVLPLAPGERLIDFGAGRGDYALRMKQDGHHAFPVEFYPQKQRGGLDREKRDAWLDVALAAWRDGGGFDRVVCDSVLNSVDSPEAEQAVMLTLWALAKPGGLVHFSGRRRERLDSEVRHRSQANRKIYYGSAVDADGIQALPQRDGGWTFQKYHTASGAADLAERYIGTVTKQTNISTSWQVTAARTVQHPPEEVEAALMFEFDLPWPDDETVGRSDEAVKIFHLHHL